MKSHYYLFITSLVGPHWFFMPPAPFPSSSPQPLPAVLSLPSHSPLPPFPLAVLRHHGWLAGRRVRGVRGGGTTAHVRPPLQPLPHPGHTDTHQPEAMGGYSPHAAPGGAGPHPHLQRQEVGGAVGGKVVGGGGSRGCNGALLVDESFTCLLVFSLRFVPRLSPPAPCPPSPLPPSPQQPGRVQRQGPGVRQSEHPPRRRVGWTRRC